MSSCASLFSATNRMVGRIAASGTGRSDTRLAYFAGFLEPRKTVQKELVSVIQEAWIAGVSTRRVDELVQAMGMSGNDLPNGSL